MPYLTLILDHTSPRRDQREQPISWLGPGSGRMHLTPVEGEGKLEVNQRRNQRERDSITALTVSGSNEERLYSSSNKGRNSLWFQGRS